MTRRNPGPSGSPLGDALSAVIACALAVFTWHGYLDALLGRFGLAAALASAPEADHATRFQASPCPEPARGAHLEHPPSSSARIPVTMNIPATP